MGAKLIDLIKIHKFFVLFSIFYFVISFVTYKDYGITFDEKVEYDAGAFSIDYYKTPTSINYIYNLVSDGPINIETRQLPPFSVYSRVYPMILSIFNPNHYFEWYHLENLLFGYLLFLITYLILILVDIVPERALLGPILLFLTPYIVGHIPANPKDIPFAWSYLLSVYLILLFNKKIYDDKLRILLLGLSFGFTTSLRMIGLTLILVNLLLDYYKRKSLMQLLLENILIFSTMLLTIAILMPFLGLSIPVNFIALIKNAEAFAAWRGTIFYLGKFLAYNQRPWHYLFVLSAIKLPLLTIVVFIYSTVLFLKKIFRRQLVNDFEFTFFFLIILNVFLYLITNPIVYNGIRHFLYLLTLITVVSAYYLISLWDKILINKRLYYLTVFYLLFTFGRMLILHPYEYVYFNEFTLGLKLADKYFQTDYWGASYKEASGYLLYLAGKNPEIKLNVFSCDNKSAVDYYSQFKYKLVGSPKEADVLVCDVFRDRIRNLKQPIIHSISRENVPLSIIRIQPSFLSKIKL